MRPSLWLACLVFPLGSYAQQHSFEHGDFSKLEKMITKKDDVLRVVNFWATWCAPCVAEMPYFVKTEQEYKGKKVEFIFVSLDFKKDVEKKVSDFKNKKMNAYSKVYWLHGADPNEWIPKVDKTWSGAIPATLITKSDKRQFIERPIKSKEDLKTLINKI